MRKIYMVFTLIFALATTAIAQNYNVTFAVDASQLLSVSADGIHIAGNFQMAGGASADWAPAEGAMTDTDGNGVWQVTVSLPAGTYLYKYINGNTWGDNEGVTGTALDATCSITDASGNVNREITISADTIVGPYIYDACTISSMILNSNKVTTEATILVAPNPMTNRASILLNNPNNETFTMAITNMMGQVVRTQNNINTDIVTIERNDLAAGVYFVTLKNEEGAMITEKLIVQ